jgi:hypothetical protein
LSSSLLAAASSEGVERSAGSSQRDKLRADTPARINLLSSTRGFSGVADR